MTEDIRWEQRFANFQKAAKRLMQALAYCSHSTLSDLEKEGLIQRFEYTYELAWKTLQDFLRYKGYTDFAGPNATLTLAFQDQYITDGEGWRRMKKSRELISHTYDEESANSISACIVDEYAALLHALEIRLSHELAKSQPDLFSNNQ